ncbi:MAG: SDR family oxidoreductase, partial [Akkermansia sp.]|nr:SDR family oxidoreductase [Akkermansia sp.]
GIEEDDDGTNNRNGSRNGRIKPLFAAKTARINRGLDFIDTQQQEHDRVYNPQERHSGHQPLILERTESAYQQAYKSAREALLSRIPLRDMGKPEDIANCALFLASDEARYITGQVLVCDGGMCM